MRCAIALLPIIGAALLCAPPAHAWDAHGHRTITLLAMDRFQSALPATNEASKKSDDLRWLFTPESRAQAAYQSGEPDRYRAIRAAALKHENDADHYIDVEDLEPFGLTLSSLPPLRYEYARAMMIAKHIHPEQMRPYNEKTDIAKTTEFPGYLPYAIVEHYHKLVASFRQARVLMHLNDPARAQQLEAAKANVIHEMGQLSHFVGDAAQPLHTTRHHHGWDKHEANPDNFTTNNGFHAYIDTTVLGIHTINYDTMHAANPDACKTARTIANPADPWTDVLEHIQRSFDTVIPLYHLQKSGDLDREPGKAFVQERLCDGATTLGALYAAAWKASAMTDKDAQDFIRYDQVSPALPNPMAPAK